MEPGHLCPECSVRVESRRRSVRHAGAPAGRADSRPGLRRRRADREAGGGRVPAIDSSAAQVGAARARGLDARRGRAETLPFQAEFDAVFSNAVLHWIPDASAAIASVHRALKPGGRFVAELGGAGCVQTVRLALIAEADRRGLAGAALDP